MARELLVVLIFPEDSTSWTYNWLDSVTKNLRTTRQAVKRNYGFFYYFYDNCGLGEIFLRDEGWYSGDQSENLGPNPGSETRYRCHFTIHMFIFFIYKMNGLDSMTSWFLPAIIFYNFVIVWMRCTILQAFYIRLLCSWSSFCLLNIFPFPLPGKLLCILHGPGTDKGTDISGVPSVCYVWW